MNTGVFRCLLPLSMLVIAITTGAAKESSDKEKAQPKPPSIAIVKTFGDLLNQPKIKLKDNHWTRLGINRKDGPLHSWVILYAITDVQNPELVPEENDLFAGQIGSLRIEVKVDRKESKESKEPDLIDEAQKPLKDEQERVKSRLPGGGFLFMKSIPLKTKFNSILTIKNKDNSRIAEVTLTTNRAFFAPWLPLQESEPSDTMEVGSGFQFPITAPSWRPSFPCIAGYARIPIESTLNHLPSPTDQKAWATLPLPCLNGFEALPVIPKIPHELSATKFTSINNLITRLGHKTYRVRLQAEHTLSLMEKTTYYPLRTAQANATDLEIRLRVCRLLQKWKPKFHLEKRGSNLLATFKKGISSKGALNKFLIRFWVNGKPIDKIYADEVMSIEPMYHQDIRNIHEITFPLDLDLRVLKAKPGDTIGVQLLYCSQRYEDAFEDRESLGELRPYIIFPENVPIISNRIEFEASATEEFSLDQMVPEDLPEDLMEKAERKLCKIMKLKD